MYDYTLRDIERNLESRFIERAKDYVAEGRVLELHQKPGNALVAKVNGSDRRPYKVTVQLIKGRTGVNFYGSCSCPISINCKHVAAVLLANLNGHATPAPRPRQVSTPAISAQSLVNAWPRPSPAEAPDMPQELRTWLDKAMHGATLGDAPETYPPGITQRLLYLLFVDEHSKRAQVRTVLARTLKSGGYSTPTPWSNAQGAVHSPSSFILPSDLRALRRLLLDADRSYLGGYILSGALGQEILTSLIQTHRCHWHDPNTQPLKVGGTRRANMFWEVNDAGTQHLVVVTDPPSDALLPLSPPWYIDLQRAESGPVDLEVPASLGELLVCTPDVPAGQAETVRGALSTYAERGRIPLPDVLASEDVVVSKITPCLRFETLVTFGSHRSRYMPLGEALDVATLTFDYDGLAVTRESPGLLTSFRDGKLINMKRDAKTEKAAHTALTKLGFLKLMSLPWYYPEEHKHDYGMRGPDDWMQFMSEDMPALKAQDWRVNFEDSFRFRVAVVSDWSARIETSGQDWFDLHLEADIDGKRSDLLPIVLAALREEPELVDILTAKDSQETKDDRQIILSLDDGRLFPVPRERLRGILRVLHEMIDTASGDGVRLPRMDAARLVHLEQAMDLRWQGGAELRALGQRLASFEHIAQVEAPKDFGAQLRPYQGEGLSWLQFLREYGINGILADDMGLGKTVQALAHILLEKQCGRLDRPVLVVSPTSVLPNWRAEAQRFAPQLRIHVSHGLERKATFDQIADAELVLTTYPLLARDKDVLRKQSFHLVILDEAQLIKNAQTQAARIVGELQARHRLCMTGTPLENHLGELWSLFHFLMPGFLGDVQSFRRTYRTPIEKQGDELRRDSLIRRIRPFILRRTKEQVAADLPPKSEILHSVEFAGAQRDLYETVRVSMHERVRAEIQARGMANSHIIVLDALLKLRQICCDPRLLKLDAAKKVKDSAKLEMLMDMLPELLAEGRRVLLFSQFTSMLALIEEQLKDKQIRYVKLTGDTKNREQPVKSFQNAEVSLFLISLKAGGTGLNLTAADTVIHYDPWWNPAVENQATDRAHRIGQDKPVFVYKLIVAGTVEEKITALQKSKADLAASLLDGAQKGGAALSADDIAALFEPMG